MAESSTLSATIEPSGATVRRRAKRSSSGRQSQSSVAWRSSSAAVENLSKDFSSPYSWAKLAAPLRPAQTAPTEKAWTPQRSSQRSQEGLIMWLRGST